MVYEEIVTVTLSSGVLPGPKVDAEEVFFSTIWPHPHQLQGLLSGLVELQKPNVFV